MDALQNPARATVSGTQDLLFGIKAYKWYINVHAVCAKHGS
jgi:hypothetical protein